MKMKGFFAKLKDFSPKLKVSEILLFLKPQNRWKKSLFYTNALFLIRFVLVLKRYHSSNAIFGTVRTRESHSSENGGSCGSGGRRGRGVDGSLTRIMGMYQNSTESTRSYPIWNLPYCIGNQFGGLIDGTRYCKYFPFKISPFWI